ncbi:SDR family oxidoreductase [Pseudohoeflea coraliihabitans]|uniref:SDR family oxidoreductase n=1 Tax=Pseudohoeflea coraliihabitans TaxID=2860393 RepID=A0ABS6WM62_9HYPH|nr:SDR family oxidoreductase [Pseudohoeflea sp. DP4N28-3]MBW3096507.1 SDR family oxidoreductase [Pseudohoeflea sp. DP4N28-3]
MSITHRKPVILITGCSSGIGAHCARRLRDDGWHVIASARKPEDLDRLRADGFEAFALDYAEPQSIAAFFEAAMAASGGRCDALYNNGAISQVGAVEDLPPAALRHQLEVNLIGYHDLTRRVIPVMRAQGSGRIVQCASVLGRMPVRWLGAYTASKYALEGLTLTLRMELAGSGIHVSLIEPGPIESNIATNALGHFQDNINAEQSPHAADYASRIDRLRGGTLSSDKRLLRRSKTGPEAVYKAVRRALTSAAPRPHYPVTLEARIGLIAQRVLPSALFYRLLARSS